VETVTVAQLRRHVVAHQRYATRFRRARADVVVRTIGRLGCVQLDSISTVGRAHRLTLGSRIGAYPEASVSRLLKAGRIFEYWAHEACLVPIEDYPLFKRRMEHLREHHWWGRKHDHDPEMKERVLDALRTNGALPTRFFEGSGGKGGGMWNWKPEKRILEDLFAAGEVVVAGRDGFQRLYDLPERVIPREQLEAPVPSEEEFRRGYALRAVEGRGALTESGIAEHCRFQGGAKAMRPVVDDLVSAGLVRRVAVDDGGPPLVVPAAAEIDGAPAGGVLICPFDNLVWDRSFLERIFGFTHVIEVYKPAPQRVYGYYVLPFLYRDRLIGRADLKSDRAEKALRVRAFHFEPGVRRTGALETALDKALDRLARVLGLEQVVR
jgi:uncharacterized protein YcaQ